MPISCFIIMNILYMFLPSVSFTELMRYNRGCEMAAHYVCPKRGICYRDGRCWEVSDELNCLLESNITTEC